MHIIKWIEVKSYNWRDYYHFRNNSGWRWMKRYRWRCRRLRPFTTSLLGRPTWARLCSSSIPTTPCAPSSASRTNPVRFTTWSGTSSSRALTKQSTWEPDSHLPKARPHQNLATNFPGKKLKNKSRKYGFFHIFSSQTNSVKVCLWCWLSEQMIRHATPTGASTERNAIEWFIYRK